MRRLSTWPDHNSGSDRVDVGTPAKKGAMKIYAFKLNDDGLVEGERKVLYDYGRFEAGCDGLTVDEKGNLYLATLAASSGPASWCSTPRRARKSLLFPQGPAQRGRPKEPRGIPANVTFGVGDERSTLYVTVDTRSLPSHPAPRCRG